MYSIDDTDDYVNHAENFIILNAESIFKIAPVMFEIFEAPYGTDLCWLYEAGVHIGFYDIAANKEVTIDEVIKQDVF